MDCQELKASVLRWFGDEIECQGTHANTLVATLPILKPNGDSIDIGIEQIDARRWKLSDLGDTHGTLFLGGVELADAYVRGYEFRQVLEAHEILDDGSELTLIVPADELIGRMFDFVHAIQSMLALQLTIKPEMPSRDFPTLVAKFLAEQGASFEVPTDVQGKTGKWKFNFALNHVREETLIKTVSVTSRINAIRRAEESVFEIHDVREFRRNDVAAIVIADDEGEQRESVWGDPVQRIFEGYKIPLYRFERNRQELVSLAQKYSTRGT